MSIATYQNSNDIEPTNDDLRRGLELAAQRDDLRVQKYAEILLEEL